ncbi:MAG: MBL fold metallo-hydrolase [Candidatus Cloacimonadales bacterium]
MLRTSVLLSGSKGNANLVFTDDTYLLLDAGLSGKKTFSAMEEIEIDPTKLTGIVISHEHGDHINGAGVISRKLNIPIYFTEPTYRCCSTKVGVLKTPPIYFSVGEEFEIGDIKVTSFSSSHDAVDSSNFLFSQLDNDEQKLAIATDLGFATKLLLNKLMGATTLILESNHDEMALLTGPYTWELKQRVRSLKGHLSNKQAVEIVRNVIHPRLGNLILAHLSETNNSPILAEKEMSEYLKEINHTARLIIADQHRPTPIVNV